MAYLIGVDLGTTGTKTVLFDETGKIFGSVTFEYPLYQEHNGWAEQEPEDWWNAAKNSIKTVLEQSKVNPGEIKGLGISGQMHGLVMLDKDGKVLRRSIIWADQRTAKECEQITEAVGAKRLIEITANPALTGFTASKILWVRNNEPAVYAKCAHILLPKDFVRYKLTGEFATEVSDASGMQLLDVPRRCWSDEVLEKLDIDKALLGKVYESPDVTGVVNSWASAETGLKTGTPVVGGAGDNAAAAVGTGVVRDGLAFTTIGSSGVVFAHSSSITIDPKGRVHTFCCAVPGAWHVMGVHQAAGLSLKWLRDNVCIPEMAEAGKLGVDPYVVMGTEAEKIAPGSERLIYLPYLNGERTPHLDPNCRGVFFGLSGIHHRPHLIRAVMEGVSYSLRDSISILREMHVEITEMMACGGGGKSPLWRQMLADNYHCRVKTVDTQEGPALGVAILAGVGAGLFNSVPEACEALIHSAIIQDPIKENSQYYDKAYPLYQKLYSDLKDSFVRLSEL
jgi:xylulokinase